MNSTAPDLSMSSSIAPRSRGISGSVALAFAFASFLAGYLVGLSFSQGASSIAASTGASPAALTIDASQVEQGAVDAATQPADAAGDAASQAVDLAVPTSVEIALAEPIPLGDMRLNAMSLVQWAAYKTEFVQKNPGLEQLDGLAPLMIEEFASSQSTMTAETAMKSALARASIRWMQQQNAVVDPIPELAIPVSNSTAAPSDKDTSTSTEQPADSGQREIVPSQVSGQGGS